MSESPRFSRHRLHKPHSHRRAPMCPQMFLKQFSEKQGPSFIPKTTISLFSISLLFPLPTPSSSSSSALRAAEKIALVLLDGPRLWAPGQFSWFPDTVHHQQPDGGRWRTEHRTRTRAIKTQEDTQRGERGRGGIQRSRRFELPPSGLSFRNKNLIA